MGQIYTYRAEVFVPIPAIDVTGFSVDASDGHIGKVDEATYETDSSCLVVDTGFWIFGKKRMIPAGLVERVDVDEKKIVVGMTKEQIKNAPDYDAERHRDNERGYHDKIAAYYEQHDADRQAADR